MNFYQNIWVIGASFGIGEELFRAFDALGANLVVSARSSHRLSQLILGKPQHRAIALDVTREQ